tara:strand:- start:890 stop:1297 length:408 start_codon:yes stop_codon:yes gene_type:complete
LLLLEEKRNHENRGVVALLFLSSVPVNGHESLREYTNQCSCHKETDREEYIAGKRKSQEYVKSFTDRLEVRCRPLTKVDRHQYQRSIPIYKYSRTSYYQPITTARVSRSNPSSSACRSSRVKGGGFAAAVSKKDA